MPQLPTTGLHGV